MKMRESAGTFLYVLEEVLVIYRFLRSTEEFPNSAEYRKIKYSGDEPPFPQMMHNIIEAIQSMDQAFHFEGANDSAGHRSVLGTTTSILRKSTLLRAAANYVLPLAERLERCLTKVCEYYHGISDLIRYAKRHFPDGVNYCWVDATASTQATTTELDDNCLEAISRALGSPLSKETGAIAREGSPDVEKRWSDNRFLKIRVHPETRILLHLSIPFDSSDILYRQAIEQELEHTTQCARSYEAIPRRMVDDRSVYQGTSPRVLVG
ncbi:hypothetical protein M404DRAFT_654265 [Pisolithus tinctorius Marx 270]|uniref:Uncharacterized protein n=1 Tax=Pisolithus tinctorius Marx 270 TaxID=870435 RepID=A0A0C3NNZ7_PISTI|nr:hypothetical protein M404DRAFT_654265 [Pisolithus tinctorius Marx 270]